MFLYGALNDEDGLGRVELGSGVVLVAHLDSGQQNLSYKMPKDGTVCVHFNGYIEKLEYILLRAILFGIARKQRFVMDDQ